MSCHPLSAVAGLPTGCAPEPPHPHPLRVPPHEPHKVAGLAPLLAGTGRPQQPRTKLPLAPQRPNTRLVTRPQHPESAGGEPYTG